MLSQPLELLEEDILNRDYRWAGERLITCTYNHWDISGRWGRSSLVWFSRYVCWVPPIEGGEEEGNVGPLFYFPPKGTHFEDEEGIY